ncbi:uncharacterized protein LOC143574955 [Bidens hawaiensis]|uniref:uncharacterized protein LOC143574955 n=1 Tax=Bidens hawaiensis TaxID=980011 RepID=UPI004049C664
MGDTETPVSKLEASDPLYLHASDSNTLTIVNIKLKGTENYTVWANAMFLALQVKNKVDFIDDSCKRSLDNEVLGKQWDRCNSVVLSWILNSVSDELYLGQVFSRKALDVWQDLKETYDKVDGSVVFGLYQKMNSLNQNGSSVSEYYHKLNTMRKQFDAMVQLPSCSCNASENINDFNQLIKLMQFLMGLDDVYQSVRTSLLTRDPLPTIKTVVSIVSREESHRNSSGTSKAQTQNMGFVSKSSQSFDTKKKFNRGPNPNLKCTHCNKIGHTVERCFEIVGYPQGPRPRGQSFNQGSKSVVSNNAVQGKNDQSTSSSGATITSEQVTKLLSLLNEKQGDSAPTSHIGVVPEYQVNLLSVHRLAKDNKVKVIFDENNCYLQDLLTRKVLVTGSQLDGLYFCSGVTSSLKFSQNIKVVRSDNGTEFVNNQTKNFFKDNGVLHQTSCTYSPQQNGVVERKHRHLLNVARSLPFQGGIPLSFWSECVLTAAYLINRTPSSVLEGPGDEMRVTNDHSSEDQPPSSNSRTVNDPTGSHNASSVDGSSEVDQPSVENENNNNSEGTSNQIPLRRSTRNHALPKKLNDFVIEGKLNLNTIRRLQLIQTGLVL